MVSSDLINSGNSSFDEAHFSFWQFSITFKRMLVTVRLGCLAAFHLERRRYITIYIFFLNSSNTAKSGEYDLQLI